MLNKLWYHEMERIFKDRLIEQVDYEHFDQITKK